MKRVKQLLYRGYTIVEENDYTCIYKGDFLTKRVRARWTVGVKMAKELIDSYIRRFGS